MARVARAALTFGFACATLVVGQDGHTTLEEILEDREVEWQARGFASAVNPHDRRMGPRLVGQVDRCRLRRAHTRKRDVDLGMVCGGPFVAEVWRRSITRG